MNRAARSVDDIYLPILERLGAGAFPLGSRLPSCRELAGLFGSNPSTVSRALRRLSAAGLVRTEERRGSFVTATQPATLDSESQIVEDMTRVVSRAAVVAVPLFPLADVAARAPGLDRVVELNFVPAAEVLRRIATLDLHRRVVVVLPTRRGIERISSLVRQYYAGLIETHMGGADDIPDLEVGDVLVTTHALGIPPDQLASLPEVIQVDWALDQHSARTFKLRVEQAT